MSSFDLDAAGLRTDGRDLATYVEVLARKFEDALPTETVVQRKSKGFLSREKLVEGIEVTLGEQRYQLQRHARGVSAWRAKEVRGVVIKREELGLDAWVEEITSQLSEMAAGSAAARNAIERLVG